MDGHHCQCLQCNPHVNGDLEIFTINAARSQKEAELYKQAQDAIIQKAKSEVNKEALPAAKEAVITEAKEFAQTEVYQKEKDEDKNKYMAELRGQVAVELRP